MRILFLSFVFLLSSCASTSNTSESALENDQTTKPVVIKQPYTPHLWSDHKILETSVDECSVKGKRILQALGFNQVIKNGTYVYGNYIDNRAAIKCTEVLGVTFVYASVAGPDVKIVEQLRNEIVWKL